eukprot:6194725-Pleurochrysis_carterae.AAC.3
MQHACVHTDCGLDHGRLRRPIAVNRDDARRALSVTPVKTTPEHNSRQNSSVWHERPSLSRAHVATTNKALCAALTRALPRVAQLGLIPANLPYAYAAKVASPRAARRDVAL